MATFAVAALVVAILFADRLVPEEDLRRRFYQVGLGATLVLLVAALAAMVFPVPEENLESIQFGEPNNLGSGILRERVSLIAGGALVLLLAGLYQWRTYPTISTGVMLGALILLIGVAADSSGGSFLNYYYELTLDAGASRNVIFGGIIAIGTTLLLIYGFNEWERIQDAEADGLGDGG